MIEKIRISLWDIFTFYLSGFLVALLVTGHSLVFKLIAFADVKNFIIGLSVTTSLFVIPFGLTLVGLLLEPVSNYFDKYILHPLWVKAIPEKDKHKPEEELLKKEIRENYLGKINGKINNPYHICKEYVETKQLSTTFMVFLSRYGFYRNISFLFFVSGVTDLFISSSWKVGFAIMIIWLILAWTAKKRAQDFYSYLSPNVYRCFLIDKAFDNLEKKKRSIMQHVNFTGILTNNLAI